MTKPKNPDRVCGYDWGGTPDLYPMDSGWNCAHVCRLPVSEHGDYHYCCNNPDGTGKIGVYE